MFSTWLWSKRWLLCATMVCLLVTVTVKDWILTFNYSPPSPAASGETVLVAKQQRCQRFTDYSDSETVESIVVDVESDGAGLPVTAPVEGGDRDSLSLDIVAEESTTNTTSTQRQQQLAAANEQRRPRHKKLHFLNRSLEVMDLAGKFPKNAAALCELMLVGNPRCRIAQGEEDMYECIVRYGVHAWDAALQKQCTQSAFWSNIVDTYADQDKGEYTSRYYELYDPVMRWHLAPVIEELRRRQGVSNKKESQSQRRSSTPAAAAAAAVVVDDSSSSHVAAVLHPPLNCSYGLVYPFGFCAPQESIVPELADMIKIFDWFPILPSYVPYKEWNKVEKAFGRRQRYLLGGRDEFLLSTLYRLSYFAWTHRRMGADCMRHYEILSAGTIPMFPDLNLCPKAILSHLPRPLLREAFHLPGVQHIGELTKPTGRLNTYYYFRTFAQQMNFKRLGDVWWNRFNETAYRALNARLFQFTGKHIVCHAMMQYVLQVLGYGDRSRWHKLRVMLITRPNVDYQSSSVEHGLFELGIDYTVNVFGEQHHDAKHTIHLFENRRKRPVTLETMLTGKEYDYWRRKQHLHEFYGKNYMVGRRLPLPRVLSGDELCEAIDNGEFDIVMYTTARAGTRRLTCESEVAKRKNQYLRNFSVAVFDGEDVALTGHFARWNKQQFTVFSREARCTA